MVQARAASTAVRRTRRSGLTLARRRATRHARRILRALRRAPLAVRILVATLTVLVVWSAANWLYQDVRSCWFNGLYTRVVPSHAVELTAALLDRGVAETLQRQHVVRATLTQKHDLAAVMHLCGAGPAEAYARRGFRLTAGQKCGEHDVARYLARVNAMKLEFTRLAAAE